MTKHQQIANQLLIPLLTFLNEVSKNRLHAQIMRLIAFYNHAKIEKIVKAMSEKVRKTLFLTFNPLQAGNKISSKVGFYKFFY